MTARPSRPRLLVADDSEAQRAAVRRELASLDIEIHEVASGIGSLQAVSLFLPDLMTLDIEMPDFSGYRVLDQLRSRERTMGVPVVMISGKRNAGERLRALEAGAIDYFEKPFPAGSLRALVAKLLDHLEANRSTTVFCLDPAPEIRDQVGRRLQTHGYRYRPFATKEELLQGLQDSPCDILLLDLHLPQQGSYEVLDQLRSDAEEKSVSVVGFTSLEARADLMHAFQLGVDDFIRKPFFGEELLARIDHLLSVRRRHAKLQRLAIIDLLTGLPNRAELQRRVDCELARSKRNQTDLGILMVDVDHFKRLNDTFGHPFGDQVLTEVAQALRVNLRGEDTVGRYGGEEFMVLLPEASHQQLEVVAERLRHAVADLTFNAAGAEARATISIGARLWQHTELNHGDTVGHLVKPADNALYRAKTSGRNRVCFWNSDDVGAAATP
jgi:two-component system cell cycle response regulator